MELRCSFGNGHRRTQQRIGAESGLILRAIEVDQDPIDLTLIRGIHADQRFRDLTINILYCVLYTLSAVPCCVTITQLHSLVFTRACT